MSVTEDDVELRDLVVQTLESNGILGKIKAQLRASVFLTLDEEEKKNPLENERLNSFCETMEGLQVVSLFKEFLKFYNLDYTLSVFEPETNVLDNQSRESLARELNIIDKGEVSRQPLICEVLRRGTKQRPHFEKEDQFDLDKLLSEKAQKRLATDFDPSSSNGNERFSNGENVRRKNSEEEGSSISSIKIPSFGSTKPLKWDKRVTRSDSNRSADPESIKSNKSVATRKQKSLKSPRSADDDEYDDDDIEEDIDQEESSTNRSDSILKDEEMTSDRTISPDNQSTACDYIEEVLKT